MLAWPRIAAVSAGIAVAGLLAGIPLGFVRLPFVRAPRPTGRWSVGTGSLVLAARGGASAVAAQVWYPAPAGSAGRTAAYGLATTRPLRERIASALVATNAIVGAPIVRERFPVVIYVPGWGGGRESNTAQAENLASNGYVVVALDDAFPEPPLDFSSEAARERTIARANRKVAAAAREVARVASALAALDAARDGRFAGRLDVERIGVLGFSFGGAVAAEVARTDPRVRAAVDLDGWLFGDALRDGVRAPFLMVGTALETPSTADGAGSAATREIVARFDRENEGLTFAGMRRYGGTYVTIDGTDHYNFTDAAWLPTIRRTGLGPIDGRRGWNVVAASVLHFFDRSLGASREASLDTNAPHDPAAHVRTFRAETPFSVHCWHPRLHGTFSEVEIARFSTDTNRAGSP